MTYQSCVIYGFSDGTCGSGTCGRVLDWDLIHTNGLEIFFGKSETGHASNPYYGIRTRINPLTGCITRGKAIKDAVDIFYQKVYEYCASNGVELPGKPEYACVLEGDMNYNLEVYSIEKIKPGIKPGIKSVVYIEVTHATASKEDVEVFVRETMSNIWLDENMKKDDFDICKTIDKFETDKTVFETFKLTFLHETKKQSHEFMKIFLKIEGRSDDDAPQLLLGTSNIYVKIHRKRAQIGNVWLNMESIMDS